MTSTKRLFSGANITCIRGGHVLFQKLSFSLDPGSVLHLSGPNGAGKTSLLRILCGALPAATGTIEWNGEGFLENGRETHAERFSFLPAEDRSLKQQETVAETLLFWAQFWNTGETSCTAALEKMQISTLKDTPVRRLSAGQKRRLSLARTFLRQVPLWLLDEPLNGLDDDSLALFAKALDAHCRAGGMAVVASHHSIRPPVNGTLQRVNIG